MFREAVIWMSLAHRQLTTKNHGWPTGGKQSGQEAFHTLCVSAGRQAGEGYCDVYIELERIQDRAGLLCIYTP